MSVHDQIVNLIDSLSLEIKDLQHKLSSLPEGDLYCESNGKYVKWYKKNISDTLHPIYLPKKQRLYVEKLALRKYYTALLSRKSKEILLLKKYLIQEKKIKDTPEKLLQDSSLYKPLLISQLQHFSEDINQWLASSYEKNTRFPEHLIHKTLSGHYVRSKSEAIIANSLFTHNIPYRYENAIHFDDIIFYPDFTLRHPKTLNFYYWEHFGMMDNSSYFENAFNKLKIYASNGIIPSINLITTYETRIHPIDSNKIKQIIENTFFS